MNGDRAPCEMIDLVKLTGQPIINSNTDSLFKTNKSSTEDSFICGTCHYHFTDIHLFFNHKQLGCIQSCGQKLSDNALHLTEDSLSAASTSQTLHHKLFTISHDLKSNSVDINLDKLNCKSANNSEDVIDNSLLLTSQSHDQSSDLKEGELFLNSLVSNENQSLIFHKEEDDFTFLQPSTFPDYTTLQTKNVNNGMMEDLTFSHNSYTDKFPYSTHHSSNMPYSVSQDSRENYYPSMTCSMNTYLDYQGPPARYESSSNAAYNPLNSVNNSDVQLTNSCFSDSKLYDKSHLPTDSQPHYFSEEKSSHFDAHQPDPISLQSNNYSVPLDHFQSTTLAPESTNPTNPQSTNEENPPEINTTMANSSQIVLRKSKKNCLYSCDICQRGFRKSYDLDQHMRTHTGEKPFQCMICGRSFSQRSNVKKHVKTHKVWPTECSSLPSVHTIAVKLDANKQLIIRPTKSIDSLVVKREYRLLNNSGHNSSVRHQERPDEPIVLVDNSFECGFCRMRFTDYSKLRSHMTVHKDLQVYMCVLSNCQQKFEKLTEFLEHLEQHKKDKETIYSCFVCNQQFNNLYNLAEHTNHHKESKKGYSCPTCRKSYNSYITLQQHLALCSHRYACSHCDKSFSSELVLRRHISIHASIRKFQCPHCSNIYKAKSSLAFHLRTHRGELPFKCEQCNKGFLRRDKYRLHLNQHEPDSSCISCPLREVTECSFTCVRNEQLIQHVASVHWNWMKRPAACAICKKRFSSYYTLKLHFNTHKKPRPKPSTCLSINDSSDCANRDNAMESQSPPSQEVNKDLTCHLCQREFQRKKPFETHLILCKQKADLLERRNKRREQRKCISNKSVDWSTVHSSMSPSEEEQTLLNHSQKLPTTRAQRRSKFTPLWQPKKTRRKIVSQSHSQDSNSVTELGSATMETNAVSPLEPICTSPSASLYNLANFSVGPPGYDDHSYSALVNQLPAYSLETLGSEEKDSTVYSEEGCCDVTRYNLLHCHPPEYRIMLGDGRSADTSSHLMELPCPESLYSQTLPSISTLNSIYSSSQYDSSAAPGEGDVCPNNYTIQSADLDSTNFFSEPLSFLQSLEPMDHDILL